MAANCNPVTTIPTVPVLTVPATPCPPVVPGRPVAVPPWQTIIFLPRRHG
jgi:hypothetical protein